MLSSILPLAIGLLSAQAMAKVVPADSSVAKVFAALPTILCHFFVNGGLNARCMINQFGDLSETTQNVVQFKALETWHVLSLGCAGVSVDFVSQLGQSSDPQHADGTFAAFHSTGDFRIGQILDVTQDDHDPVVVRKSLQGGGKLQLLFVSNGSVAWRTDICRQYVFESCCGLGQRLFQIRLACDIAFLRTGVLARQASKLIRENLS
jgi:uncharacterized protein (DUF2249 family)